MDLFSSYFANIILEFFNSFKSKEITPRRSQNAGFCSIYLKIFWGGMPPDPPREFARACGAHFEPMALNFPLFDEKGSKINLLDKSLSMNRMKLQFLC
jgi:hypothetical protein